MTGKIEFYLGGPILKFRKLKFYGLQICYLNVTQTLPGRTSASEYVNISKLRYYVNSTILINLYYSLIYPFLTYGVLSWGNAYTPTLQPLYILQKKAMRTITFSNFDQHSTPLFRLLNIIKLYDLVSLHISVFMFKFHNRLLPS